jgi:hypothetical protein
MIFKVKSLFVNINEAKVSDFIKNGIFEINMSNCIKQLSDDELQKLRNDIDKEVAMRKDPHEVMWTDLVAAARAVAEKNA